MTPLGAETEPQALPQSKVWAVFGGLMLAMLLAALDQTIVATALPTIVSDLGGAEHLSWVVTAYMLASTATTVLWGKLGDLFGRKTLFITCIVIFLVGSILLSLMDQDTTTLQAGVSMFVLGAGLGMVTQVLVIAVQNAVSYRDLGTATSGATYFRTIGSSVGVAAFGTIFFTNRLTDELATAAPGTAQGPCSPAALIASTQVLGQCPPEVQTWFLDAYAGALHVVFLGAVPVAALAFLLTWLLPEVELRTATRGGDSAAAGHAAGASFALPSSRTSLEELRMILWRRVGKQDPLRVYDIVAQDVGLAPEQAWMVARVSLKRTRSVRLMAERTASSEHTVQEVACSLAARGLVEVDGDTVRALPAADVVAESIREAERERLRHYVAEWPGGDEPEVEQLVNQLAHELLTDKIDHTERA